MRLMYDEAVCAVATVSDHAKCENCESTEAATTSQLTAVNSPYRSEKSMISVGHTKVKSSG